MVYVSSLLALIIEFVNDRHQVAVELVDRKAQRIRYAWQMFGDDRRFFYPVPAAF